MALRVSDKVKVQLERNSGKHRRRLISQSTRKSTHSKDAIRSLLSKATATKSLKSRSVDDRATSTIPMVPEIELIGLWSAVNVAVEILEDYIDDNNGEDIIIISNDLSMISFDVPVVILETPTPIDLLDEHSYHSKS